MVRKTKDEIPKTTAQQLGSLIKSARDIMRKDKGLNGDLDRLPMLTWIMFLKFLSEESIEESKVINKYKLEDLTSFRVEIPDTVKTTVCAGDKLG